MTLSFSSNCRANRDSISDYYLSWMASLSEVLPAPPPDLCAVLTPLKLSEPSVSLTGDLEALIGCICLSSEPVDFLRLRLLEWCLSLAAVVVSLGFKSSPKFWLDFLNVNLWFKSPFWPNKVSVLSETKISQKHWLSFAKPWWCEDNAGNETHGGI